MQFQELGPVFLLGDGMVGLSNRTGQQTTCGCPAGKLGRKVFARRLRFPGVEENPVIWTLRAWFLPPVIATSLVMSIPLM